jgi:hypothetical protein
VSLLARSATDKYLFVVVIPAPIIIPQGSVLGPLLYNIYVNDLCYAAVKCCVTQYADDTCVLIKSRKDATAVKLKIENVSLNVLKWFESNKLAVNIDKSRLIMFGRHRHEIKEIQVGAQNISCSDDIVYLGLRIDRHFSWHGHIEYVISRIRQFRLILCRLKGVFDLSLRIYLTKTLIMPVIDLYDFIYCTGTKSDLRHLDVAYNDLMRTILGIRRSEHMHVTDLYKLTTLNALEERRNLSLARFMASVVNGRLFSTIRSDCIQRLSAYATRSQNTFVIPKIRTNVGSSRICVRGLKLLNQNQVIRS